MTAASRREVAPVVRDLVERAPSPMALLRGPRHVFAVANPPYLRVLGGRALLGKPVREAVPELAGQGFFELLDNVYATGESFAGTEMPVRLDRPGGDAWDTRYFTFVYQAVRAPGGSVDGVLVYAAEVTEGTQAHRRVAARAATLRVSEERLRLAQRATRATTWDWDLATDEVVWGTPFQGLLGPVPRPGPTTYADCLAAVHPDDRERVARELAAGVAAGEARVAYRVLVRGEVRWLEATGRVFARAGSGPARMTGVVVDVTAHKRAEEDAAARLRLVSLAADVGAALAGADTLRDSLGRCAEALVCHLDAAFARVWTLDEATQVLELQASAGLYAHLDGPHGRVPVGALKIGRIARDRTPYLTNRVVGEPRVSDQEWVRREGLVAFAGYPLIVEERVVGVMALFARHALTDATLQAMAAVADGVAVGIVRWQAEVERARLLAELQATVAAVREANRRLVVAGLRGQELTEAAETALAAARRAEARRATARRALARRTAETAALRELNRLKDEFLGTVSHELRTPLQVVGGYGELLQLRLRAPGADSGAVALADHVVANAAQLAHMVEELLDFAHLGHSALPVRPRDVDLVPVIKRLAAALQETPGGERLVAVLPATLPAHADPARVVEAVTHLIDNALTYAPDGPITLRARPTRDGAVRVEVGDRGPGVAPAERRRVWEKFYRGSSRLTGEERGVGIGLAVVKALAEAQGGRVGLACARGRGSRFWFELPG